MKETGTPHPDLQNAAPAPPPENRKRLVRAFRIEIICFALVLALLMGYGVYVLTPKHVYGVCPMLNLYLQPRNTADVLVVGTSVAYSGVNTNVLWREYGLACYNLCSAEIPYWASYYQLREALRYQKPKLILLDAKPAVYSREYSLKGRTIQSTFGILHPVNRIGAILACQKTLQQAMDFVWAYPEVHKNYKALDWEDFRLPPGNGTVIRCAILRVEATKGRYTMNLLNLLMGTLASDSSINSLSKKTGINASLITKLLPLAIPILKGIFRKTSMDMAATLSLK